MRSTQRRPVPLRHTNMPMLRVKPEAPLSSHAMLHVTAFPRSSFESLHTNHHRGSSADGRPPRGAGGRPVWRQRPTRSLTVGRSASRHATVTSKSSHQLQTVCLVAAAHSAAPDSRTSDGFLRLLPFLCEVATLCVKQVSWVEHRVVTSLSRSRQDPRITPPSLNTRTKHSHSAKI